MKRSTTKKSIFSLLEYHMENTPFDLAVVDDDYKLTFGDLRKSISNCVNKYLSMIRKGDVVAINLSKKAKNVVIMLSIMYMGGVYIPIDSRWPTSRILSICKNSNAKYIISETDILFDDIININVKNDIFEYGIDNIELINNSCEMDYNDLVYIIYTSGSNGKPKGVMIENHSLLNLVNGLNREVFKLEKKLNIAVFASFAFDASVKQIFFALCFGNTLYLIKDELKNSPKRLFEFLHNNNIDTLDLTPSYLKLMASINSVIKLNYYGLEYLLIGGELLKGDHVLLARAIFGDKTQIYNMYGPTECCVDVAVHRVEKEDIKKSIIPIGKALPNIILEIDDKNNELIIKGECVGRGYVDSNDNFYIDDNGFLSYRTGDIAYNENDMFYIVGRKNNNQIKINGYRVDLAEIDYVIQSNEEISFSITKFIEKGDIGFLASIYVSNSISISELRSYLKKMLPQYMIPKFYCCEGMLRLTNNGKVNEQFYTKKLVDEIKSIVT